MKSFLYLLVFAVFLASCSKTEEKEQVNVQQLNQQFIGAWNSKDAAKLDTLLAEDVHFLQGEVHYSGKAEVSQKWVRETIGTIADLKLYTVSSGVSDTMAYEGGTFSVDVLPSAPDMPHGTGEGNFILLWKKNNKGLWKLHYAQLEDLPVEVKGM